MEIIKKISIVKIGDPENPMRTGLDHELIFQLSESIKREGLINPITVRPVCDFCRDMSGNKISHVSDLDGHHDFKFEVVAGHRRFTACKLAGLNEITCVVRELSDSAAFDIMAHENLERQDVDPVDEAIFLGKIIGEDPEKVKDMAVRLNRTVEWIESRLEILRYPANMLAGVKDGRLKLGVAHWLGLIENDYWRDYYVNYTLTNGLSVLQARVAHDQWAMGILKDPSEFNPESVSGVHHPPQKAHAICAACKQMAEDPNLQLLFTHVECPAPVGALEKVSSSDGSLPPPPPSSAA